MNNTQIPESAFSEALSAYRYFDKVDEGCGYDRLHAKLNLIRYRHQLTEEQLSIVDKWAYNHYYKQPSTL